MFLHLKEIRDNYLKYFDLEPVLGDKFIDHYNNINQDGVFDAKTKRLIALCGSIIAGCKGCILGQVDHSINHGATAREILEVCSISMSLGGTLPLNELP
ncbi:carboxymuconolactone decarboxylase family protein [Desulfoscipio gibsoniae]|uniref:Uncharacterized protein, gamma-carboxymuconolactone decarboxylase subunit like protein n=1 Tax=Desulfoscipio gibsoniae DSM 7213 TaxID=767817 RepID=R4KA92_9FIRM|nr:carboxymuconolactone decarboxylase family protein [Desulfoscipio gibsoniae]AGL00088.1 uncharacterized protein, gamma-carboxymuconolactone decarboxylase subunit like protein [Desulfoscipio gibsoniae DSM 7213]